VRLSGYGRGRDGRGPGELGQDTAGHGDYSGQLRGLGRQGRSGGGDGGGQPRAQRRRLQHLDVRAEGQELAACLLDAWVRHMLLPEKPDLDAYLADFMPDGLTGRVA